MYRRSVVSLALGAVVAMAVASLHPATASAAGLNVCTLVSQQEAAAVLDGAQMQAPNPAPAPALQCDYRPVSPPLTFRFNESDNPDAQININDIVVSLAYGAAADSLWNSAFSKYGHDLEDEAVANLGDEAYYVGSVGDLIVRQGSRFVEVKPDGDHTTGFQGKPYPDLHAKLVAILAGFARPAIQRMPASLAATPGTTSAGGSVPNAAGATPSSIAGQSTSGGAPWGAVAGIALVIVIAAGGYSFMRRRASPAPTPEVPQPALPPYEQLGGAPKVAPVVDAPGSGLGDWHPQLGPLPLTSPNPSADGFQPNHDQSSGEQPASKPTPSQVAAEGWPMQQINVLGGDSGELDNHGFPRSPFPAQNHLAADDGGFLPEHQDLGQVGKPAPASPSPASPPPPSEPKDAGPQVEQPELPQLEDLGQSEEDRRKAKDLDVI